jgi:hypothetical protein
VELNVPFLPFEALRDCKYLGNKNGITTAITLNTSNWELVTYQLPQATCHKRFFNYNCQKTCQQPQNKRSYMLMQNWQPVTSVFDKGEYRILVKSV